MTNQDIFGATTGLEERSERAKAAVKAFRAMQPGLSGYARAITGRRDVQVELAQGTPRTDGKKIFFKPPIALGDNTRHDRMHCEKRDPDTMQLICPACKIREEVLITIYHEIAHIAYGTFEEVSDAERQAAIEKSITENGSKYAKQIEKVITDAKTAPRDYLNLAGRVSAFLPPLVNGLEDARVDAEMFKARKGTRVMFDAYVQSVFRNGVQDGDESWEWKDKPLNSQVIIGIFVLACEYTYKGWFHPEVEKALGDMELNLLVRRIDTARSAQTTYQMAFPILARLRELGFCKLPEDPQEEEKQDENEPEQPGEDPQDQGEDESPEGADSDSDGTDGEPGVDPSGEQEGADADDSSGADGSDSSEEGSTEDSDGDSSEGDGADGSEAGDGASDDDVPADDDSDGTGADERQADDDSGSGSESESSPDEGAGEDAGSGDEVGVGEPDPAGSDSGGAEEGGDPAGESDGGDPEGEAGAEDVPGEPDDGSGGGADGPADEAGRGDGPPEDADDGGAPGDAGDEPLDDGESTSVERDGSDDGDGDSNSSGEAGPPSEPGLPGLEEELTDESTDADGTESGTEEGSDGGENHQGEEGDPGTDPDGDSHGDDQDPDFGDGDPDDRSTDDPESPEGDGPDALDTGADDGEGGQTVEEYNYGTPDGVIEDVQLFGKHEVSLELDPAAAASAEADDQAIEQAIVQSLYFEAPSANIKGVREHTYGNPIYVGSWNSSFAWDDFRIGSFYRRQAGKDADVTVPEAILGPALVQMRRTFTDNQRASFQRHMTSGKVNARVLGKRAWSSDERLFQKKRLPGKRSYAVLIGIDISGSTYGVNIALAKRAAMAQAELCHRLGIDFAVYAHTAHGDSANNYYELWLDVYEIKGFDQPWDNKTKEALTVISSASENLDGHTLEYYRKKIEQHRATDKVIMYYSDGKMPAANHDEELEILQREIKYCDQRGITLMGVGIRTDSPRRHGLDTVQVDSDEDMVKVVKHLESRLLRRR